MKKWIWIFAFMHAAIASADPVLLFKCHQDHVVDESGTVVSYVSDTEATLDDSPGSLLLNLVHRSQNARESYALKSEVRKVEYEKILPGTPGKRAGEYYFLRVDGSTTVVLSPTNELIPWFHVIEFNSKLLASSFGCEFDGTSLSILARIATPRNL